MKYGLILSLLIAMPCVSQTKTTGEAKTAGPCSPAVSGSKNTFTINCGISQKQGQKILGILNKILADQTNTEAVMAKLDELLNEGLLIPGDEPPPVLDAIIPKDALVVNFGSNFAFSEQSSFVVCNIADEDILTMSRSTEGIALNARIYSADGRIVAEIEGNEFTINPNNYFRKKRPDKSTLIVYDQTGEEAINVHFSNRAYVIITGKFYKLGYGTITVTSSGIHTPDGGIIRGITVGKITYAAFSFKPATHN